MQAGQADLHLPAIIFLTGAVIAHYLFFTMVQALNDVTSVVLIRQVMMC